MARYPDDPAPQGTGPAPFPFSLERPLARGGPTWAQKTRALTRCDLYSADLTYVALSWTQVKVILDFWNSVGGGNGTFSFADFGGYERGNATGPGVAWSGLYIAKADGILQAWTLPTYILQCHTTGGLIDNVTVRVAGTAKPNLTLYPDTSGSDGYIRKGYGADGFDWLHLAAVPSASAILDMDGTCRRGVRNARIMTDKFPFKIANPANYQGGVISIGEQVTS